MVLLQISSIILAIGASIALFVQSVSLSTCKKLRCCDTACAFETTREKAKINSPSLVHPRPTLEVKDL